MKPAPFTYHRPRTITEAVDLLAGHEDAKVLAGGQSLLPIMNMRLAAPAHLVDLTGVAELRRAAEDDTAVHYGATTTHMMIEDGLVPDPTHGLLPHAATGIGYRAIRTSGTLGGSLAHSDSSAEWPTVLSALDAAVLTRSPRGPRRLPVRELLTGFFSTILDEDEIITSVEVRRLSADTPWGLYKMARKPGEFGESLAVVLRYPSGDEVWLGAARDTPVRLPAVEQLIAGRTSAEIELPDLAELVGLGTGTEGHPRQLHAVAVLRALRFSEQESAHV